MPGTGARAHLARGCTLHSWSWPPPCFWFPESVAPEPAPLPRLLCPGTECSTRLASRFSLGSHLDHFPRVSTVRGVLLPLLVSAPRAALMKSVVFRDWCFLCVPLCHTNWVICCPPAACWATCSQPCGTCLPSEATSGLFCVHFLWPVTTWLLPDCTGCCPSALSVRISNFS